MTVYLDELFALNAAVNYLLLAGSARIGGGRLSRLRLWLAAGLGGVYAAAALAPELSFLRAGAMQAVCAALMLLTAFGAHRRTLRLGLLFVLLALTLGGLVFLGTQVLGAELLLLPGGAYYPVSVPGLLLLASGGYLIVYVLLSRAAEHGGGEIEPLTLELNGRTAHVRALRDTGNTLRDPITNERVLVVAPETARQLLPEAALEGQSLARADALLPELARRYPALHPRLIPYRAVGTASGVLLAVRCFASDRKGRRRAVLTAFSPTALSDGGSFDALTGGML